MHSIMRQMVQCIWAVLFLLSLQLARASESTGAENNPVEPSLAEHLFDRGHYEAALSGGVFFSPFGPSRMRPTIDYSFTRLQLGYMLGGVKGNGLCRGNFELAAEGFGNAIFEGPGGYIAGGTLWLRYNFVPKCSYGFVPHLQAGGGFVSTDIDRGIVGQPFNFNLDAGVGVRYLVGRNWSISLEFRYQHISNADLGIRNLGINAAGPILGVSYFF